MSFNWFCSFACSVWAIIQHWRIGSYGSPTNCIVVFSFRLLICIIGVCFLGWYHYHLSNLFCWVFVLWVQACNTLNNNFLFCVSAWHFIFNSCWCRQQNEQICIWFYSTVIWILVLNFFLDFFKISWPNWLDLFVIGIELDWI